MWDSDCYFIAWFHLHLCNPEKISLTQLLGRLILNVILQWKQLEVFV